MAATHERRAGASAIATHAAADLRPVRDLGRPGLAARPHRACRCVLKGILTAEDAGLAVEHGVDGDRSCPTTAAASSTAWSPACDALPEVVAAVGGRVPGAVRRRRPPRHGRLRRPRPRRRAPCCVGRPVLWALAADGADRRGRAARPAAPRSWRTRWRWPGGRVCDLASTPAAVGPDGRAVIADVGLVLAKEALHASVCDPVAASMNFLNEVAGRFPDAISLAAGPPVRGVLRHRRHRPATCRLYLDAPGASGHQPDAGARRC